jgi:hypothetical protein
MLVTSRKEVESLQVRLETLMVSLKATRINMKRFFLASTISSEMMPYSINTATLKSTNTPKRINRMFFISKELK